MDLQVKEDKGEQSESGFFCKVCDCVVKDSLNYLDHVNGKRHNRNLGISLKKFTDSTLQEVKQMLELKKREREEKASGYSYADRTRDEEEKWKKLKRDKKNRQKARRSGGYSAGKNEEDSDEDQNEEQQLEEDGAEDEPDDEEEAMARLMGFSNFSSSKK